MTGVHLGDIILVIINEIWPRRAVGARAIFVEKRKHDNIMINFVKILCLTRTRT